ncbi:hypothetical protein MPL3356_300017 [Mesorhizobium plurifarium]|uniref:Uncharacterized protein n=1 Tax=Mesorhizobium plurifarium TaxID=69974 RepID=A0A090DYJ4_MESPL|nr:hypothetical protein MPL3356_300017 [Mesorhizobium plurifarium]
MPMKWRFKSARFGRTIFPWWEPEPGNKNNRSEHERLLMFLIDACKKANRLNLTAFQVFPAGILFRR